MATLTAVKQIHYQKDGQQPKTADHRFSHRVESNDSHWQYEQTVGPDWVDLDLSRVEKPVSLMIVNEEGVFTQRVPTVEQRNRAMARVVEVAFSAGHAGDAEEHVGEPAFLIPPGRSLEGCPVNFSSLRLRCRSETARCTVYVFPA